MYFSDDGKVYFVNINGNDDFYYGDDCNNDNNDDYEFPPEEDLSSSQNINDYSPNSPEEVPSEEVTPEKESVQLVPSTDSPKEIEDQDKQKKSFHKILPVKVHPIEEKVEEKLKLYGEYSVKTLKILLKNVGAKMTGKKEQLIERYLFILKTYI